MLRISDSSGKMLTDADREQLRAAEQFHRQRLGISDPKITRRGIVVVLLDLFAMRRVRS